MKCNSEAKVICQLLDNADNVAFIVRACNSHDKLVGLLKEIIDNEYITIFPTAIEGDAYHEGIDFEKWEQRVRIAIGKKIEIVQK